MMPHNLQMQVLAQPVMHLHLQVEYLHNLAYQALETVRCKKRPGEGEGVDGGQEGGGPTQVLWGWGGEFL